MVHFLAWIPVLGNFSYVMSIVIFLHHQDGWFESYEFYGSIGGCQLLKLTVKRKLLNLLATSLSPNYFRFQLNSWKHFYMLNYADWKEFGISESKILTSNFLKFCFCTFLKRWKPVLCYWIFTVGLRDLIVIFLSFASYLTACIVLFISVH